jgi:crotonobetaine/carnitine-CoA ligase
VFRARFGTEMGCQAYGQTELMSIALSPPGLAAHAGELGKPSPFVELTLLGEDGQPAAAGEIGEIAVRPRIPQLLFDGYWGQPEATREAIREGCLFSKAAFMVNSN